MNLAPIAEIKAKLKRTYSMFDFEVNHLSNIDSYEVICYKERIRKGNIVMPGTTPTNVFWDNIKEWITPIIRNY